MKRIIKICFGRKSIFSLISLSIVIAAFLIVFNFPRQYKGDGTVKEGVDLGMFWSYSITFPLFPLKQGTITQKYRFQGTCSCNMRSIGIRFRDQSGKQLPIANSQQFYDYVEQLSITVKLLKNDSIVFERKANFGTRPAYLGYYYYGNLNLGDSEPFTFSNRAKYELWITVKSETKPPKFMIAEQRVEGELSSPKIDTIMFSQVKQVGVTLFSEHKRIWSSR